MASITRESIAQLHDKIVVTLTNDDYRTQFEKALKQYGKTANIPGFRKGMVPSGMIKRMYGPSVFADEVIRTANTELNKYLEETKPEIFAQPLPLEEQDLKLDMNSTDDIVFAFEIGLKPEFEIDVLKNKKGQLTRYKIAIGEEIIQKETENLKRRTGEVENPESPEEDSDMVYSTYAACDENGNVAEGTEATEDVVILEKLPAQLAEAVKGQKAGFTHVFKPSDIATDEELENFMKDALKKGVEEKDNYFKFTLTKTGRLKPSEMNEDFFSKVFPNEEIKDEAQFIERLKEELEKEADRVAKDRLENDLFEILIHETNMDLPVAFLKSWLKRGGETPKTEEEVEKEYPDFDHRLRWTLISDKLIRDMGIEVSTEEIKQDMEAKVRVYFGVQGDGELPWLEDYLTRMMSDNQTMEETHSRLLFEKLFNKIAEEMEVKEEIVDEDTFAQLQPAHHHHH